MPHRLAIVLLLTALVLPGARAAEGLVLRLGTVAVGGWQAEQVELRLDLGQQAGELAGVLHIERLSGPELNLRDVRLHCPRLTLQAPRWQCAEGRLRLPALADASLPASFSYSPAERSLELKLADVPVATGSARLELHWREGSWQADLQAQGLALAQLRPLAAPYLELPSGLSLDGRLDLQLELAGQGAQLQRAAGLAEVGALALEAREGRLATDQLGASLQFRARAQGDGIAVNAELEFGTGQAYLDPVFVDFAAAPLNLSAAGRYADGRLVLTQFFVRQPELLLARGELQARLAEPALERLDLEVVAAQLPGAYQTYLRPFLIGTPLDALETGGRLSGHLLYREGAAQAVDLQLHDLQLDDSNEQFALYGLDGELHWRAEGEVAPSRLSWSGGYAYRVPLGATRLRLRTAGRDLQLLEPLRLPILDGALLVDTLRVRNAGTQRLSLVFDAELKPLSLRGLANALGWPPLAGTVAGSLPTLTFEDGELTLGGELTAKVFDGTVRVANLRLSDPFGTLPRLAADVEARRLDLSQITEAFSFGLITGQLNADIQDLRLIAWEPAAFNARFYTPEHDPTRHRISQRAIENISSLGGAGAAAALSRGFLSLFETFAYAEIGLSCRLRGNVCLMSGLAPANGGYYIIRGKGLPRIDVVGYAHAVNWPTLVEQLQSATAGEGPVVR